MQSKQTRKLYCYVDETGQDTKGQLFIVVAILADRPNELAERLEAAETSSGKGKVKWHRSRQGRDTYIESIFSESIHFRVYYQTFTGPELSYELATVQATANAIDAYCHSEGITDYKATIVIDGLHRSLQHRTGKLLRNLGIRTKSVRGERDETNPMIRLADAIVPVLSVSRVREILVSKRYKKT
jgi:Protein of unknown function (DUF3800)